MKFHELKNKLRMLFQNAIVKPSGLGALSPFISIKAEWTSVLEKGISKFSASCWLFCSNCSLPISAFQPVSSEASADKH